MSESTFLNSLGEWPSFLCNEVCQKVQYIWENNRIAFLGTVSFVVAVKVYHIYKRNKMRKIWDSAGRDVVVLHAFPRGSTCINISPFVIKVETYLRMAGIKYEFETWEIMGPKSKTPWITLNGEDIADSDIILDFLAQKFDLNFSKNLTAEQNGASRSITIMVDEHLFWGLIQWRFDSDKNLRLFDIVDVPIYYRMIIRLKCRIREKMRAQGLGLHSEQEIETMMAKDIEALSLFLGNKPFLMGNKPCEVDCAVFGILAQFVWVTPGSPYATLVQSTYLNLLHYCFRMRDEFYPDWENLLNK